jgi:diketogulonate reductase-like aldo/keto reductase
MGRGNIVAIPKAGTVAHVYENRTAADVVLSDADSRGARYSFPATKSPPPARNAMSSRREIS